MYHCFCRRFKLRSVRINHVKWSKEFIPFYLCFLSLFFFGIRTLLIEEASDSNKQWYTLLAHVMQIEVEDPFWFKTNLRYPCWLVDRPTTFKLLKMLIPEVISRRILAVRTVNLYFKVDHRWKRKFRLSYLQICILFLNCRPIGSFIASFTFHDESSTVC